MEKNKLLTVAEKFSRKDLESSSKRKEFAQEVKSTVQELLQSNDQQKILEDLWNIYWLLPASNDAKWILGTIISWLHNARIQKDGSIGTIQADAILNDSFYGWQSNEDLTQAYNAWKDKKIPEISSNDDTELQQIQDRHTRIHQKRPEAKEQPSRRQRQKDKFNRWRDNKKDATTDNASPLEDSSSSLWQSREFPPSNHEDYMPK